MTDAELRNAELKNKELLDLHTEAGPAISGVAATLTLAASNNRSDHLRGDNVVAQVVTDYRHFLRLLLNKGDTEAEIRAAAKAHAEAKVAADAAALADKEAAAKAEQARLAADTARATAETAAAKAGRQVTRTLPDGRVVTVDAQGRVDSQGRAVDSQGRVVDSQGRDVDSRELGTRTLPDGRVVDTREPGIRTRADGRVVDSQGRDVDSLGRVI